MGVIPKIQVNGCLALKLNQSVGNVPREKWGMSFCVMHHIIYISISNFICSVIYGINHRLQHSKEQ